MRIGRSLESDDHVHSIIELRKSNRYALRAPVLFDWAPQNGEPQSGRGVTRDINTFGVYIVTDALPPVGALVQMDILLPKLEAPGFGMSLAGEGIVLRVEPGRSESAGTSEPGFAASVQFYPETTGSALSHLETFGRVV
jgi:hypothetical protein